LKRAAARAVWLRVLGAVLAIALSCPCVAQSQDYQREFQQPKAAVDAALKKLQGALSGRLPVLDGFATGKEPLERYQRAYYQTTVQVSSGGAGVSTVRVTSKVTAWYADPSGVHSGYRLLTSNGRLESDFLDLLADQLGENAAATGSLGEQAQSANTPNASESEPLISAPTPRLPDMGGTSDWRQGLAERESADGKSTKPTEATESSLQAEARALEEILKKQTHPNNLVAVKKAGTPVVSAPSLTAKTLFLASAHDEFEMLNFNADWVHVRISGLSRGWIWRNSLEMPNGIPDGDPPGGSAPPAAAELFRVTREETATFPGDWEPLRGKSVEIVSVQKVDENAPDGGLPAKLEYAKFLLNKSYAALAPKSKDVAGIVLIFDAADGGMIAAPVPTLQQWKAGTLSDAALWHQCFFDPPETLAGDH
jgi:hypothetical protein